ncbi:unnamed protein product, partial [Prorocentrum cordatum]
AVLAFRPRSPPRGLGAGVGFECRGGAVRGKRETFQLDARPNHSAVTLLRLDPEDRLSFRRAPDSREHSRTLRLTNRSGGHVAYKVKTTAPEAYAVQKHLGKIGPGESCDVTIVLQDPWSGGRPPAVGHAQRGVGGGGPGSSEEPCTSEGA